VAVDPDATIWIDLWVPHTDDMVDLDVVGGLRAIGELWHSALTRLGANEIDIVDAPRPEGGEVACFGGLGHGEIVGPTGAKVVGITAWRSRQGSLFQCASYLTPCTDFLVDALDLSEVDRRWLRAHLTRSTELLGAVIPSIETSGGATAARAQMSGALRDAWVATGAGVPVTEVVLPVKLAGERASADRIDEVE
jgi:hypothetical protein